MQIVIPKDEVDIIQHYDIEYHAMQEVIITILNNNYNIDNDIFKEYQKEYDKRFYKFNKEKERIENIYVLPEAQKNNYNNYNWNLNYYTGILTINETV